MVRLGVYETNNSNNNKEDENKDKKHNFAFDFFTNEASISPNTLGIDNHGTDCEDKWREAAKEEEKGPGEEKEEGEKTSSEEGVQDNLSQVWRHFLEETSLHGCKNVKERQIVKRLVWCCCILMMASVLTLALIHLYLRYQEHPFVSVWGFERQSTVPVPGLTICIPAKYNREKLENARPAYKLLAYDETDIPEYRRGASRLNGYEKYLDRWREELSNITMSQAIEETGFTKEDIFYYSAAFAEDKRYDLVEILEDWDMDDRSCWMMKWHHLGKSKPQTDDDNSDDEDIPYDEDPDRSNAESIMEDEFSPQGGGESHFPDINARSNTGGGYSADQDSVTKDPSLTNPTFDSVISNLVRTTASPSSRSKFSRSPSSETTTSGPRRNEGNAEQAGPESQQEEDGGRGVFPNIDEHMKVLRLSPRDSIIFVMNLHQNNWLSTPYFAGVELYFHDLAAAYWSVNPILVRPGTMTTIYYKPTRYKFLPLPYKSFGGFESRLANTTNRNYGCTDIRSPGFKNPMLSLPPGLYSGEMCMMEAALNRSTKTCGCSVDKFFNRIHETHKCSVIEYNWCFAKAFEEEYYRILAASTDGASEEQPCPNACTMTQIETTVSAADYPPIESHQLVALGLGMKREDVEKNFLMISIKPQGPLMTTVEHVPELTLLNIIGSVGGWMGLCLGASLLTLTELFEAIIMSVWILYRKLVHRLRAQK